MSARPCGPPASQAAPPHASGAPPGAPSECPMCGLTFTSGLDVCGACPLHGGCDLVRCPRCLYTFPRRSRLVDFVRRLARRPKSMRAPASSAGLPPSEARDMPRALVRGWASPTQLVRRLFRRRAAAARAEERP